MRITKIGEAGFMPRIDFGNPAPDCGLQGSLKGTKFHYCSAANSTNLDFAFGLI